ncbi:MAG: hypothetical protein Q9226_008094 [Calogaya cf. arnoldii]
MAVNSDSSHQGLTNILQKNLDELRNLVACRICIRPMYEPYTTQCGHTFCYSCLRQWFDRDQIKKTCPDCRAHVQNQPAPAFLVREITQTFVNTAALLPAGETTEDHRKPQRDEAELVEKDKFSGGGLFNGRFNASARYRAPIRDSLDGVDRCPSCTWELEDGMCHACGYSVDERDYTDESAMTIDDLSMDSDHSDISLAAEALLAEDANYTIDRLGNVHRVRRRPNHLRQHMGLPSYNRRRRSRRLSESSGEVTDGHLTDRSLESESTGSTGSIRDFVADEAMGIDDARANSDHNSEMPTSTYDSGFEHPSDPDEPSSPPFDLWSNMNPNTTARRRFRGRRVAMSSPELSSPVLSSPEPNDIDSDTTHSTQQTGQHYENYSMPGGFSPLLSSPVGGRSLDMPISIDSDSDVPPVRPVGRRRNRPTTLSISSDGETSGTRGDLPLPLNLHHHGSTHVIDSMHAIDCLHLYLLPEKLQSNVMALIVGPPSRVVTLLQAHQIRVKRQELVSFACGSDPSDEHVSQDHHRTYSTDKNESDSSGNCEQGSERNAHHAKND